jgi:hypothetical protein
VVRVNVLVYVLTALIALGAVGASTAGGAAKGGSHGPVVFDAIMPSGG